MPSFMDGPFAPDTPMPPQRKTISVNREALDELLRQVVGYDRGFGQWPQRLGVGWTEDGLRQLLSDGGTNAAR